MMNILTTYPVMGISNSDGAAVAMYIDFVYSTVCDEYFPNFFRVYLYLHAFRIFTNFHTT